MACWSQWAVVTDFGRRLELSVANKDLPPLGTMKFEIACNASFYKFS